MRHRMSGGIHPNTPWPGEQLKIKTDTHPAEVRPPQVTLPLHGGPGASVQPLVKTGDTVKLGQLIASSDAKVSAHVHASVSGPVTAIGEYPTQNGKGTCIIIENDQQYTLDPALKPKGDPYKLSPEAIVEAVQAAGIVGMGGATFPTHVKLQPQKPVDLVLVNGCECEPLQAADDVLMVTAAPQVLAGCRAAMKAVGATKSIVGIESNKPAAIEAMRREVHAHSGIQVQALKTLYPQGGEKQLVQALSGREVPEGGLPADAGVVVLNVATCAAIAEALHTGMPSVHRIITVTGDVRRPQNLLFPIGTLAADLIDACGGFSGTPSKVIAGGPMMGKTLERIDVPLLKGANGLIIVGEKHDHLYRESPCIRCNRCAQVCPMRLMPMFLDRWARAGDTKGCRRFKATSCINCGCCTYVCPARRRLAETIWGMRGKLAQIEKEAKR